MYEKFKHVPSHICNASVIQKRKKIQEKQITKRLAFIPRKLCLFSHVSRAVTISTLKMEDQTSQKREGKGTNLKSIQGNCYQTKPRMQ